MSENISEKISIAIQDGEIFQSQPLFTTGRVLYPAYLIFIAIATSLISLNQKKFRKRWKVDNIYFFIAIYLLNFLITWYNFKSIPKFPRIGIPILILFAVSWFLNKFQIIGLTGGISCGKSTVSNYFSTRLRITVIDCDILARRIMEPGKPAYQKVVEYFGPNILISGTKEIDRKMLGQIVFSNQQRRAWLTRTTGWYIFIEILREIWIHCYKKNEQMVMLDAPLLFESKYLEYMCYPICCVYITDEKLQCQRLMERDNCSEEDAMKKIKSQMSISKKMAKSDILLCNDGTKEQLIKEIGKSIPKFVF